jgi:hypothetical protein
MAQLFHKQLFLLSRCDFSAFHSAGSAGSCTFPAMFVVMEVAFIGTGLTCFSANKANGAYFFTVQSHQMRSHIRYRRTFHSQLNASCHLFDVRFDGTGYCAMITVGGTMLAGLYAGLISGVAFHSKRGTIPMPFCLQKPEQMPFFTSHRSL